MKTLLLPWAKSTGLLRYSIYFFPFYLSLVFAFFFVPAKGQNAVLPEERVFDWQNAGLRTALPSNVTVINVLEFQLINDGTTPNDQALKTLIAETLDFDFVELFFPEGEYLFTQAIELRSNLALRGVYPGTTLVFEQTDSQHSIIARGEVTKISTTLTNSTLRSAHTIEVENAALFQAGDLIKISENDELLVTSDWAIGSTGQLNYVAEIKGDSIILEHALRRDFAPEFEAKVERINPIRNVRISELKIERKDATSNQTSNLFFNYAANCAVRCIESNRCNFAHVDLRNSTNIEVTGSYFHEGLSYGGGGKAYGVMLHFSTGECLITNSVFRKLRHSMILQAGANGNVFAYNYSSEPYWTGTFLPPNSAGDMVLHGNYPFANLFEGNSGQNIVIDDSHGRNGPFNTFLRNRADGYGVFMNFNPPSDQQTFIGNEISNPNLGFYFIQGTDHVQIANNVLNTVTPGGSENLDLLSLLYDTAPSFFIQSEQWPGIGYPNNLMETKIPAEKRMNFELWTACMEPSAISTAAESLVKPKKQLRLYPNPVFESFRLDHPEDEKIKSVQLFNTQGKLIHRYEVATEYNTRGLHAGLYWLMVEFADRSTRVIKLIKE